MDGLDFVSCMFLTKTYTHDNLDMNNLDIIYSLRNIFYYRYNCLFFVKLITMSYVVKKIFSKVGELVEDKLSILVLIKYLNLESMILYEE